MKLSERSDTTCAFLHYEERREIRRHLKTIIKKGPVYKGTPIRLTEIMEARWNVSVNSCKPVCFIKSLRTRNEQILNYIAPRVNTGLGFYELPVTTFLATKIPLALRRVICQHP